MAKNHIGRMMESLDDKIARVIKDEVDVVEYDSEWPRLYAEERSHLQDCFPGCLVKRIEHFGSTSVPGLAAKTIVDILVELTSLDRAR